MNAYLQSCEMEMSKLKEGIETDLEARLALLALHLRAQEAREVVRLVALLRLPPLHHAHLLLERAHAAHQAQQRKRLVSLVLLEPGVDTEPRVERQPRADAPDMSQRVCAAVPVIVCRKMTIGASGGSAAPSGSFDHSTITSGCAVAE